MRAAGYRFRSEVRTRWAPRAALAVVLGALAATVFVCAAGARRTGSAHDRFAAASNAYDVAVATTCRPPTRDAQPQAAAPARRCHDELAQLPSVAAAATIGRMAAAIETLAGRSVQLDPEDACFSGPGEVALGDTGSGPFGRTLNGQRLVEGRAADPTRADEVVVSKATADRLRLHAGDELRIQRFGADGCEGDRTTWSPPVRVRIVGVELAPGEVKPPSGPWFEWVYVTPAFVRDMRASFDPYLAVRLRPGASVAMFQEQAARAGAGTEIVADATANANAVENAIRPNQVSLALLAALTAIGAAAIFGPVLARHAVEEAKDDAVLRALGMDGDELRALNALRGASLGAAAAILAVAISIAVSPAMPIGIARTVEPHRGVAVDTLVLGLGALVLIACTSLITTWATRRLATERRAPAARSVLERTLAGSRLPLTAMLGTRFAVRRRAGDSAVPVMSSFGSLTVAVAAIVGALTFSAGLDHLRATPSLIGWNWDLILTLPEDVVSSDATAAEARERVRRAFAHDTTVTAFTAGMLWSPFPQGRPLEIGPDRVAVPGFLALDDRGPVTPSIVAGRAPANGRELLLGPETLRAAGVDIGDEVDVFGRDGTWDEPGPETTSRMRVVGTGVIPFADQIGHGAAMTIDGAAALNSTAAGQAFFFRYSSSADRDGVVATFRRAFPEAPRDAIQPFGEGDAPDVLFKLDGIDSVPELFAALTALMGAAVLVHVVLVATRARRRDLTILRALGLSRRQTAHTVAWQAVVYASVAVAVGTPLGIVAGRTAWRAYALGIDVVPAPVTPWARCTATVALVLALAVVLALPARRAVAPHRTAGLLRVD
jgi:putative ABC transport system permease protein